MITHTHRTCVISQSTCLMPMGAMLWCICHCIFEGRAVLFGLLDVYICTHWLAYNLPQLQCGAWLLWCFFSPACYLTAAATDWVIKTWDSRDQTVCLYCLLFYQTLDCSKYTLVTYTYKWSRVHYACLWWVDTSCVGMTVLMPYTVYTSRWHM